MWSDPPVTLQDALCRAYCTQPLLDYFDALLADPANDERAVTELSSEARDHQSTQYSRPRLSPAALETFPLDPLDDPGYLYCEPWGLARQIFVPHQLEFHLFEDRVEMRYGEWEARRTVYTDGRALPERPEPTLLAYSVGYFDGDTLVVESNGVRANITLWLTRHSDQLRIVERYIRDGDRLSRISVVREFRFVNPHAELMLEVTDANGNSVLTTVEFDGALNLTNADWAADTIRPGERVTIHGNPSRSGDGRVWFLSLKRTDGTELLRPAVERINALEEERRRRAQERSQ